MPRSAHANIARFASRIARCCRLLLLGLGVCSAGPGGNVVGQIHDVVRAAGPCGSRTGPGPQLEPDGPERPAPACDGGEIEMERACHCLVDRKQARPWGKTADLALEMPRRTQVASGARIEVPYALRHKGKAPIELDFSGGAVVRHTETLKGRRPVEAAPCGVIGVMPDAVRLTLRPGAVVRGTVSWKAANHQGDGCADLSEDLRPGRYRIRFATISGTPPLSAAVDVTVTREAAKKADAVDADDGGLKEER